MKAKPKEVAKGIPRKLYALRKELNLTTAEMAKRLGITQTNYLKYERGDIAPSIRTMKIIQDNYNLSMDWLIFGRGLKYVNDADRLKAQELEINQLKTALRTQQIEYEAQLKQEKLKTESLEQDLEKVAGINPVMLTKTGIPELLDYIEKNPVFYYKLMLHFEAVKGQRNQPPALESVPEL